MLHGASVEFQGRSIVVQGVSESLCPEGFSGVPWCSRAIPGIFQRYLSGLQERSKGFKGVSGVFQGVSRMVQGISGGPKGVPAVNQKI